MEMLYLLTIPTPGRILRFLASNDIITEDWEDNYAANNITHTLARPGFRAGIAHSLVHTMNTFKETKGCTDE